MKKAYFCSKSKGLCLGIKILISKSAKILAKCGRNAFCLFVLASFLLSGVFCSQVSADVPSVVSGRVLQRCADLGDDSAWMEIARTGEFSLILRQNSLPERVMYTDGGTYDGYANSVVKRVVDKWFSSLGDGLLRRSAVGNTAVSNLGCYRSLDNDFCPNTYNKNSEARGSGLSVPWLDAAPSAFVLSFQEARKFLSVHDYRPKNDPGAYANQQILAESRKEPKEFLGFKYGTRRLLIDPYWLRSPGKDVFSASCGGKMVLENGCTSVFNMPIRDTLGVRPALWVRSAIFSGVNHPLDSFAR